MLLAQELPIEVSIILSGRFALAGATLVLPIAITYGLCNVIYDCYNTSCPSLEKNMDTFALIESAGAATGLLWFAGMLLTPVENDYY